ncbi:MAG TPA: ion channel [Chitinophagaceae bacterium]|nr:hypothetical protein [Chitinophagaceae bacterium]MCB0741895.1 hypothetical protein [Chitinophagaceae bacterium]HQV06139.1 ion channel [Chitinophagaceae bacterium]
MAIFNRLKRLRSENASGYSNNSNDTGGRFVNKNGKANVLKRGAPILSRYSWYHTLLEMKLGKFLLFIFGVYIVLNLFFAGLYYLIGIEHLEGVHRGSAFKDFTEVFFFSAQTFTTVGYGRISPNGFLANSVSTFEAFLGLLSFAIATGLFYGRFARPQTFLKFSKNALIAPYLNGKALMFRIAPFKNNNLSELEVKVTMAITTNENGQLRDKFYVLDLEMNRINAMALSWTIVHPITKDSPLDGFTKEDIANTDIEIIIFIKGFDEVFSTQVVSRTSYISEEIIWGAKFKMMYHPNHDKSKTILSLNKINDFEKVDLTMN